MASASSLIAMIGATKASFGWVSFGCWTSYGGPPILLPLRGAYPFSERAPPGSSPCAFKEVFRLQKISVREREERARGGSLPDRNCVLGGKTRRGACE